MTVIPTCAPLSWVERRRWALGDAFAVPRRFVHPGGVEGDEGELGRDEDRRPEREYGT